MLILRSASVLPVESEAINRGCVAVQNGLIAAYGHYDEIHQQWPNADELDFSDCVLLPGLVNAHTHLELSDFGGQIPYEGDFVKWINCITSIRRNWPGDIAEIIAHACQESLRAGVTTVGDICFKHRAWPGLADQPIRKTCFAEVFGLSQELTKPRAYLTECIEQTKTNELLRLGISPHAPYTTGASVYHLAAELAAQRKLPLTTHLAETTEEIAFLSTGVGKWRNYLERIHYWDGSFQCPGQRPVEYFLQLDLAEQPFLLAHVNYINDDELQKLAQSRHSVVFCPRSHAFFAHPEHRFAQMMAAGINVCLGTDSLVSNKSLSILDEMRFLHRKRPDFPADSLLRMATINGAYALGWDDKIGSIVIGKEADLIAIRLSQPETDPITDILESNTQPQMTVVRGEIIYKK